MRVELPEFKRCCCCIPLRYGLIAWTYIRTICVLPMIMLTATLLYRTRNDYDSDRSPSCIHIVLQSIFLISLVLEVLFNIVFIIGAHTKEAKLLKFQYYYNMVSLVMFVIQSTTWIVFKIVRYYVLFLYYGWLMVSSNLCLIIVCIVIQTYTLLLTRSEIRKLNNNIEFRFVNNAAEAQCVGDMAVKPDFIHPNHDAAPPA